MTDVPLPFDPQPRTFSRINALYLAHASAVAYQRAPTRAARELLGLRAIAFRSRLTRMRGFIGVCETHSVLAFRGTDPLTLPNWVTDVVVKLVSHAEYEGRVHHGFSSVLKRSWRKLEPLLEQAQDKPLFVTGHSMGGALAVLAGCRLAKSGVPPTAIYTFGSPRVGDRAFCAGYALPTFRVVNGLDLVPEMPLASVKRLLPATLRVTNDKWLARLRRAARKVRCYGHVKTLVYLDREGGIHLDADVEPWHLQAVAQAIATRGKPFVEGVNDHLISNYIGRLETSSLAPPPAKRRERRSAIKRHAAQ